MTTALIAEDEPLLAQDLQAQLGRLWPELEVLAPVGDGQAAVEQALTMRPDLCFLDIRMPGLSGLEAAARLAEDWDERDPFPLIVFVTAYEQHALQAFERQAVDYLVKPVAPERLAACVERLQRLLAGRAAAPAALQAALEPLRRLREMAAALGAAPASAPGRLEVIAAQVGASVHLVPIDEVIYFEAADKYLRVVTAGREHLIRMSLRELLPQLDPKLFWQVHRGTVVRARCIRQAQREESGKVTLTLAGRSEKLTASRLYAHLFRGM